MTSAQDNLKEPGELPEIPPVNYFNYFTEIEEHFVRRRGKHLWVSSLDWVALMTWKEMQVPLQIVLKGIDRAFDGYEKRGTRPGIINSILYCQQSVLECFEEYRNARVGEGAGDETVSAEEGQFSGERLREHIQGRIADLDRLASRGGDGAVDLAEPISRSRERLQALEQELSEGSPVDTESLEMELTRLEQLLLSGLKERLGAEEIDAARAEGERQLKPYRKRMDKNVFEQTLNNFVDKQLRERYGLPRLSLFYL